MSQITSSGVPTPSVVIRWCSGRSASSLPRKNRSTPASRIVATEGSVTPRAGIPQPFVSLAGMADRYVTVARVAEVPPGSVRMVQAGDEEIAIAQVDGEFHDTQHACIHLQGPL